MKLGLVRMSGERVTGVQYFESKFSRELGEILRINGVEWRVGVIAEDRNSIIKVLNEIVRIQNSIGKLHPSRTQCGRHLHRNHRGTFVLDTKRFMEYYDEDPDLVCSKCLEKLKK